MLDLFVAGHLSHRRMKRQFEVDSTAAEPKRAFGRLGTIVSRYRSGTVRAHTIERARSRAAAQHMSGP